LVLTPRLVRSKEPPSHCGGRCRGLHEEGGRGVGRGLGRGGCFKGGRRLGRGPMTGASNGQARRQHPLSSSQVTGPKGRPEGHAPKGRHPGHPKRRRVGRTHDRDLGHFRRVGYLCLGRELGRGAPRRAKRVLCEAFIRELERQRRLEARFGDRCIILSK